MPRLSRQNMPLCYGPVCMLVLDMTATLVGQTDAYWMGDYKQAIELNPLPEIFIKHHPLSFIAMALTWAGLFSFVLLCLSRQPAKILAWVIMLAHGLAACTWLTQRPYGLLLGMAVLMIVWYFDRMIWDRKKQDALASSCKSR